MLPEAPQALSGGGVWVLALQHTTSEAGGSTKSRGPAASLRFSQFSVLLHT